MKTSVLRILSMVVLGLSTTLFSTCDTVKGLDDITFNTTLEAAIDVSAEGAGTDVPYEDVIILDAATDPDINEYLNKIKGFTIKSIRYRISSYDGPAGAKFSGSLGFGEAFQSASTVAVSITDFDLELAYNSGQLYDLAFSQTDINTIQGLLLNDKAVNIYLEGTLSETPLYCTVTVYLDVDVTADAL
ncbi:MAG: hypothetical protein OEV74_01605 [Cyclobacteriaceae bacterium]|nr:hypothetical protein [Cyclobacteriaceae bacterium]MDH5250030.1 hypothetical protein [Cyclobacteriaceae bacterium]